MALDAAFPFSANYWDKGVFCLLDRLVDLLMRSIPRSPPVQISGQDGNGARVDRMRSLRLSLTGGRGQEAPDITCAVPRANACTIAV